MKHRYSDPIAQPTATGGILATLLVVAALLVSMPIAIAVASPLYTLDTREVYAQGAVGTTSSYFIVMFNTDSTSTDSGSVSVSLAGSSEFQLISGSSFEFKGYSSIEVAYSPTSLTASTATIFISSSKWGNDSVILRGNPLSHEPLYIGDSVNEDSVDGNALTCVRRIIVNPNANAITIDSFQLTRADSSSPSMDGISLSGLPSLPFILGAHDTLSIMICADGSKLSEGSISGRLYVYYADANGVHDYGTSDVYFIKPTKCVLVVHGGDFGTVSADSATTQNLILYNPSPNTTIADQRSMDGPFRFASGTFPQTLAGYAYDTLKVTFDPSLGYTIGSNTGIFRLNFAGSSDSTICSYGEYLLTASVYAPVEDTVSVNLFPDSVATITITTSHAVGLHLIEFQNNSASEVVIDNIVIGGADSADFYFLQNYVYDSIPAGGSLGYLLASNLPRPGTYDVDLNLTLHSASAFKKRDHVTSFLSRHYRLIANRVTASVSESKSVRQSIISVSPNPAQSTFVVSIDNVREANVELFNILGQPLNRQNGLRIEYDAHAMDLRAGTYFVRATGRDLLGNAFVESRRIVIAR